MAASRIAPATRAARQNRKRGSGSAEPQEEPAIALEQINQQTLRITMLLMLALFGVMFWAIWSDFTVFKQS